MADILPRDLQPAPGGTVLPGAVVIIDDGAGVYKATVEQVAATGTPLATSAEVFAGASVQKYLNPERTVEAINTHSPVRSVNGETGVVILTKDDIGLGNVENIDLSAATGASNIGTVSGQSVQEALDQVAPSPGGDAPTYTSVSDGLSASSSGRDFTVDNGDGTVTVYLNDGGVAVEQRTLATTDYLASAAGAGAIGMREGGSVQTAVAAAENTAALAASSQNLVPGSTVRTSDGSAYLVLAPAAPVYDFQTVGGSRVQALPASDGKISREQLNLGTSGGAVAAAITSGRLTRLNFNFTDATTNRNFSAPTAVDTTAFSVNGADFGSNAQAGTWAALPPTFPASSPVNARFVTFGLVQTDFDVAKVYDPRMVYPAASIKTYYIDPINGTAGGTGTEADPMDRPSRATALEATTPSAEPVLLFVCKPGRYDQTGVPWAFPTGLVKPYGIVPWEKTAGQIKLLNGYWANSRTWVNDGGGVWSSAIANCGSVFDERYSSPLGDALFYPMAASVGDLVSGSWVQDGGTVRIATIDGRQPDEFVGVGRQLQSPINDGTRSQTIYAERTSFLGGVTATRMRTTLAYDVDFYTKDCVWMFSSGNGMEVYGHRLAIHQNGRSAYNLLDGFNYHSDSATLTRRGVGIEINCVGYENGYAWSSSTNINNGTTAHDRCIMMRYGGVYFQNQGPNVADVNGVDTYLYGVMARDSRRAGPHPDHADFDFADSGDVDGVRAWVDCCHAPKGTSLYAVTSGADTKIKRSKLHAAVFGVGRVAPW